MPAQFDRHDEAVGSEFDAVARDYETAVGAAISFAHVPHDVYIRAKVEMLLRLMRRRQVPRAAQALDVGCGVGLVDEHLLSHVEALHGVDLSGEMVEAARARNPTAIYRSYQGTRLPYEDASFDVVFAMCVLHHVPAAAQPAFLNELRRVTRRHGLLAIFEHNPLNPLTRVVVRSCVFDKGVRLIGRRALVRHLREAGVDVTDQAYLLFSPWRPRGVSSVERPLERVPFGAQYVVAGRPAR